MSEGGRGRAEILEGPSGHPTVRLLDRKPSQFD
jgi:hypothetical protein